MLKHAAISSFLSQTKDRFHVYNQPVTLEEKFRMIDKIKGIEAVEIVYPYEVHDPAETKALLEKYGVKVAAVNVNIKAEPEFINGGITSSDPAVRARAVGFIKEAKDFAVAIGADKVTCCPLGDGYEFNLQVDYIEMWNRIVDSFREAGEYFGDFPLFIEYKPSETRGRCFINDAAKTMAMIRATGRSNLGVTLDFGHSAYGDQNPAEELSLLEASGIPYYIHINDNDGRWDWDFFCGSHHYLAYIEFIYYLRKYGYSDYLTSDTSPTRWDIIGTFEANSRITARIEGVLDSIGDGEIEKMIAGEDYLATWKFIEEKIFRLGDT
jgi:sugar phosphate isomerase/epimerase